MKRFLFLIIMVCFTMTAVFVQAASVTTAHTTVELVSDQKTIQPGKSFKVALKMSMDEGWHVYWKNPGDSGLAPTIQWTLPSGLTAGKIQWPAPIKINVGPLTSYGYEGQVFLITELQSPLNIALGSTVNIKARVDWLTCRVDCIPGRADLELSLPIDQGAPKINPEVLGKFEETIQQWPVSLTGWSVEINDAGSKLLIDVTSQSDRRPVSKMWFYPDRADLIDHAALQTLTPIKNGVRLTVAKSNLYPKDVFSVSGILVRHDGWSPLGKAPSLLIDAPVKRYAGNDVDASHVSMTIGLACLFAFLGGLILNLMPCVLPVLSLKVLGLVKHSKDRNRMLSHGLVFTAGVLISFWILAGVLISLKEAGQGIGWGFQFQAPWFVVVIIGVLFLCALNLFGIFEISLDVSGFNAMARGQSVAASFWSGVLATVVATPCTAPFMGTAIGFALSQSPVVAILVFSCMALGMAMPYLLLSAFPNLLIWVPKPGAWMVHLKIWLGFVLMGSVVWLVWVLGIQKGVYSIGLLLSGLLFLSLGSWLVGITQQEGGSWYKTLPMVAALILGMGFMGASALTTIHGVSIFPATDQEGIVWKDFSPEFVAQQRAQNKPIFIDFTAAWCLTCQVNDRLVFSHRDVQTAFKTLEIVAVKADWTSRDETITKALASYGKNSIPLYVFYPAGASDPVILPELVTPQLVVQRLRQASQKD